MSTRNVGPTQPLDDDGDPELESAAPVAFVPRGTQGGRGPLPTATLAAVFPDDARAQWLAFCWALTGTAPGHDPHVYVRLLGERADIPRKGTAAQPQVQARRVAGPASELWPRLQSANARGWAVYVQVNEPTQPPATTGVTTTGTTGGGAKRGRWTKDRFPLARAAVVEVDTKLLPTGDPATWTEMQRRQAQARANSGLPEPTLVVLSRGGPHLWWTFPQPLPAAVVERLSAGAAEHLGADPNVWDRTRVLRAPGFFHWKRDDGFFVRLVGGTGCPVDPHAFAAAIPEPLVAPAAVDPAKEVNPRWEKLEGEERQWALQECARLLVELGPSVEGKGGDNHLYRKVLPMLQDHGLTWEDALPLLHGWNATCQPPWSVETLRAKWGRAMDVREEGPRAVELRRLQRGFDELLADSNRETLPDPAPNGTDPAPNGTGPRPFDGAPTTPPPNNTGGGHNGAGGHNTGGGARVEIHYRPGAGLLDTVQECLRALAEPLGLWDFNGTLARTVGQRLSFGLGGRELVRAHLQAHVQLFTFSEDSRRKRAPLTAYKDVARCLAELQEVTGLLPRVKSVCLHPQVLPDGEAVVPNPRGAAGGGGVRSVYDAATETLFLLAPSNGAVGVAGLSTDPPVDPLVAAGVARDALLGLVRDFPFASDADRSAWLATLLTVFCRRCVGGPAPLFLFEGNQSGAGKSLLADVVLAIQGDGYAATHWQGDAYQDTAQLFGLVQANATTVFLDNVSGQFGDVVLDSLLTGESFTGRLLGGATQVTVDTGSLVWLVTGNNLVARRDLARRTLRSSLVNTAPPDARRQFHIPNLLQHVKENRAYYQSCVLTVLAGYVRAGAPPPPADLVPFRSFDGWTRWVRGTLAWLGMVDVFAGHDNENLDRAILGDDESETELERDAVVRAVLDVCGAVPKGTEDVVAALADPMAMTNPALAPLLGLLRNKKLPYLLRTHHRAVTRDGWQLKSVRKSRWAKRCWYVERAWAAPDIGGVDIDRGPVQGGAQNTTSNVLPFKR